MAERKAKLKPTGEDRSFGEVLRTKSTKRILPQAVNRFEAGRKLYVREAVSAAEAEIELLLKERKRIQEGGEGQEEKLSRLEGFIAAVESDRAIGRATLGAIEHGLALSPGGWVVIGRVLQRDGTLSKRAEVVFLGENSEPVKELEVLKLGTDAMVRNLYAADIAKRLAAQKLRVAAAVRAGGRIIAKDETPVPVLPDQVYQFDLRVETAL